MLFFIDESWQEIAGHRVCSLGGVAMAAPAYNRFCRQFFAIKRDHLGAEELSASEVKGGNIFAKSAFMARERTGTSQCLSVAADAFSALKRQKGFVFTIWTANPDYHDLRSSSSQSLAKPIRSLLYDFRVCAREGAKNGSREPSQLLFDERNHSVDAAMACAVTNFLARTSGDWQQRFLLAPTFVASAISPGLQMADLVAYLGAHRYDRDFRPELSEWHDIVDARQFTWSDKNGRSKKTVRSLT